MPELVAVTVKVVFDDVFDVNTQALLTILFTDTVNEFMAGFLKMMGGLSADDDFKKP
jgi:hypothetical protein